MAIIANEWIQIFITDSLKASAEYKQYSEKLDTLFEEVASYLNKYSVPFFSQRYAGHMSFETSIPAITGWLLTVLFNPNNVRMSNCHVFDG
jgi:hypothetical protein